MPRRGGASGDAGRVEDWRTQEVERFHLYACNPYRGFLVLPCTQPGGVVKIIVMQL
jgi:hypothetical protein